MAIRQIKDAKDLSTNELIYFKGHAKATYMSDGSTVEDAIASILAMGSSGSTGGGSSTYAEVHHGTSDTTFIITSNTFHVWDEVPELTLTLGPEISGVANEYVFQFTSGSTPTVLILPDDVKFTEELVIEANKIYQISILKGLASVLEWDNVSIISFNINQDNVIYTYNAEEGMTWEEWVLSKYNTTGYKIDNGAIFTSNLTHLVTTNVGSDSLVSLSSVISAEHNYGAYRTGSGGGSN